MDYSKLIEQAKQNISGIPIGQIFYSKDLFQGTEWNKLQRGERSNFGKLFKNAVADGKIPGVVCLGKADSNLIQYQRESVN